VAAGTPPAVGVRAGVEQREHDGPTSAAAVDIQRGALYHHIGNKEELLFQISTSQVAVMLERALATEAGINDPEERLRVLARTLMENIAEHSLEWTVHYRDFPALTGKRRETMLQIRRE